MMQDAEKNTTVTPFQHHHKTFHEPADFGRNIYLSKSFKKGIEKDIFQSPENFKDFGSQHSFLSKIHFESQQWMSHISGNSIKKGYLDKNSFQRTRFWILGGLALVFVVVLPVMMLLIEQNVAERQIKENQSYEIKGRDTRAISPGPPFHGRVVQTAAYLKGTIGGPVDFQCTYTLGEGETVISGLILWQVETQPSVYENIASFSPPGGPPPRFISSDSSLKLKNRTELLNVTDMGSNTFKVVMRLREVKCIDENKYRCLVTFMNPIEGPNARTADTIFTVQAPAEQLYDIPVLNPSNIEESMKINLSCTANVGKPPGLIKWWRFREGITAPVLMGTSSETPQVQAGVCAYNVTFSIQPVVTKDDDQSVWRCSVENDLLSSVSDRPYQETQRINVYYKIGIPEIIKYPDNSKYVLGSSVTLTCRAQGNPSPDTSVDQSINKYVWTFKAKSEDNATELVSVNGRLNLTNLEESSRGVYTCIAFNGFNGKAFNNSADIQLQIECTNGYYGNNCSTACGHCLQKRLCAVNGTCYHGCMNHFKDPKCAVCKDGFYNSRCTSMCGKCLNNEPCDKVTGECRNGCQLHFEPPLCQDNTNSNLQAGTTCNKNELSFIWLCVAIGILVILLAAAVAFIVFLKRHMPSVQYDKDNIKCKSKCDKQKSVQNYENLTVLEESQYVTINSEINDSHYQELKQ
ncbi:uncharacterized protein LOC144618295 isoform X2 [Crassostrea virginica]